MRSDRTVSVSRSSLATTLDVSSTVITKRIKKAHEAGLLDTIVVGRPGITAVYQGLFPGNHVVIKAGGSLGTGRVTKQNPEVGNPVVAAISKTQLNSDPTFDVVLTDEACMPHLREEEVRAPVPADLVQEGSNEEKVVSSADGETPTDLPDSLTRARLLDAIQACARASGRDLDVWSDAWGDLIALLEEHDQALADYAACYWNIPAKAANRYEAGKQLNLLLNTYRVQAA